MPYESNIFETGNAGFALAPELMQLNQVIRMRNEAEKSGLDVQRENLVIGGLKRREAREVADEEAFGKFNAHLAAQAGRSPEEVAAANQDYLIRNPEAARNQEIKESLSNVQSANDSLMRTRQNSIASRDMDFNESMRDEREAKAIADFRFEVESDKTTQNMWKGVQSAEGAKRMDMFNSALSQSSLPKDVVGSISDFGAIVGDDPEHSGDLSGVAALVGAVERGMRVESSFNPFLAKHRDLESKLKKFGVTPDDLLKPTPEGSSRIKRAIGNDPQASRDFNEYHNLVLQKRDAVEARNSMVGYLQGGVDPATGEAREGAITELTRLFEEGKKTGDMSEFKKARNRMSIKIMPLATTNAQAMADREASVKAQEENFKIRKLEGDLLNQQSLIKSRDTDANLKELVIAAKKQNLSKTNAAALTGVALKSKMIKLRGTDEEKAQQLADFQAKLNEAMLEDVASTPIPDRFSAPPEE